ncbi:MAG TPA: phosphoribosylformylglycinamidine synthase subunit PurS [Thermoanaerobaculia bacterium]|nr:phosphoribosylformylglycinamidine synthase subunit PurS [Thermoanaerobaculia bacterium]
MTDGVAGRSVAAAGTGGGAALSRWTARVRVMPRPEILDPQGKAIGSALGRLGFAEVEQVRAGKSFDLVVAAADRRSAELRVERMCSELLANPIIEDYELDALEELEGPAEPAGGDGR